MHFTPLAETTDNDNCVYLKTLINALRVSFTGTLIIKYETLFSRVLIRSDMGRALGESVRFHSSAVLELANLQKL